MLSGICTDPITCLKCRHEEVADSVSVAFEKGRALPSRGGLPEVQAPPVESRVQEGYYLTAECRKYLSGCLAPFLPGSKLTVCTSVHMMWRVEYEWDEAKAEANAKKHRIRFADAVGVFEDEATLSREDKMSEGERRYVAIGMDFLGRILTVVYTYRSDVIRLISARRATKNERESYEGRRD